MIYMKQLNYEISGFFYIDSGMDNYLHKDNVRNVMNNIIDYTVDKNISSKIHKSIKFPLWNMVDVFYNTLTEIQYTIDSEG